MSQQYNSKSRKPSNTNLGGIKSNIIGKSEDVMLYSRSVHVEAHNWLHFSLCSSRNQKANITSFLLVEGKGPGRDHCILEVNAWLKLCCSLEDYRFFDNGRIFWGGLLSKDRIHPTRIRKSIFAHCLANLERRALN